MAATLALLPSAVVLIAVLGLRWSGLAAATAATAASVLLWIAGTHRAPAASQISHALLDAGVLTLLVAATTVPGLLFVEATRRTNATAALARVVSTARLAPAQTAILVAVGIGVTLESLTGMGVSLLVTIPLLLGLAGRREAILLALIGMSLMPWGALAISAHVGAKLSGLPLDELSRWIALVCGPVAFSLPLLCLVALRAFSLANVGWGLAAGAALVGGIAGATVWLGVEIAGVAGGLAVVMLMLLVSTARSELAAALSAKELRPYVWLLLTVVAQKLVVLAAARVGFAPKISTSRVDFAVLTSPGLALMAATLLAQAKVLHGATIVNVARRAWRPVASVALFMIAARLLVECGATEALAGMLNGLGREGAAIATAILGGISGFATGSGVTGNALFMPSAAAAGAGFNRVPLFAALQSGAAGHFAMASLPVIALLVAALPDRARQDEVTATCYALLLAVWHLFVLIVCCLLWLA